MNSIASKLTTYILSLTLLILAVTCVVMYRFNSAQAKLHAQKYANALMQNTISDMAWDFKDVEHIMLSNRRSFLAAISSPDSLSSLLSEVVADNDLIMGASVAFNLSPLPSSPQLMLYVATDSLNRITPSRITSLSSYNYRSMSWFTEPLSSGRPQWSEPYFDTGLGNRLMTTYSMPLVDHSGQTVAILTADLSLLQLDKEINRMRTFADDFTFVLSGAGNYVAHSKWSSFEGTTLFNFSDVNDGPELAPIARDMLVGRQGTQTITLSGSDMLVCYAPLKVADWSICYVCPYRSILASLNSFTLSLEISLLLLLLLLIFAIWRIISRQMRPAQVLTQATLAISEGRFDAPLPEIKTNDEFRRLHDAFALMQSSLRGHIDHITALTQAKEKITSELRIAHDIQMHLIPKVAPDARYPQIDLDAILTPAKEVGGDLYDYLFTPTRLYFVIADVSGKGVPASLIMATTRAHFRMICPGATSAADIAAALNNALCLDNDTNMFVTAFIGIIDLDTLTLQYCNAGHCPPILVVPAAEAAASEAPASEVPAANCRFLPVEPNLPLGIIPSFSFQSQTLALPAEASLLLYTDGLTEAEDLNHRLLGSDAIISALSNPLSTLTPRLITERLSALVAAHAGDAPQSDDLTLFAIKTARTITIPAHLSSLDSLPQFLDSLLRPFHLPSSLHAQKANLLNLALEEALVNIINYAYSPSSPSPSPSITLISTPLDPQTLKIVILDHGSPFDPTAASAPDLSAPLDDRPIGGLGIHLLRTICSFVSYLRIPESPEAPEATAANSLTLLFSLTADNQ